MISDGLYNIPISPSYYISCFIGVEPNEMNIITEFCKQSLKYFNPGLQLFENSVFVRQVATTCTRCKPK